MSADMPTASTTATSPASHRRTALIAGIFYLLTFVSIPTLALYRPVKGANYVLGSGPDTAAIGGGILEIIVAVAGIGTAVVLFPILKKQNESAALGLVAARIVESATIFVGVAFLLSIVTLRKSGAGADALATSHALVAMYDRIFLLGQSFMPAICDLLLGLLLYQSRLVPRRLSVIGIVGSPILIAGYLAVLFGGIHQHGPLAGLSALPVALFEFSLGVWLVVKGFNPRAVAELEARSHT
jgi:cytochrome bd-type quinol oxidase subunit 2